VRMPDTAAPPAPFAPAPGRLWRRALRRRRDEHDEVPAAPVPSSAAPIGLIDPLNLPAEPPAVVRAIRRLGPRPKIIAFINPKGGVHKTTATVLTAATLGSLLGPGVLAWDDNELRGTLGLRAGTARHGRTVRHLLQDLVDLESTGGPYAEDLDAYLRHQLDGDFEVLAADEDPRIGRLLSTDVVVRLARALTRRDPILLVDTGNNVDSDNWRAVVDLADQLVVVTLPREDSAFTADWMLDVLCDSGFKDKVANAVTVFSAPSGVTSPELVFDLSRHFRSRTRTLVYAPYDPELEQGSRIQYSSLAPATRDAWARITAEIVAGL
jgi:MinD-like ATPase involved in chromosome partitioning or flagellar assembly